MIFINHKNEFHREDGPAVIASNGNKWYINNELHRIDGPAEEFSSGYKSYYIMDKEYSYEEWLNTKDFPLW